MSRAFEFASLVCIGLLIACALLTLRWSWKLLLRAPWLKARRKASLGQRFASLMESDFLTIETMEAPDASHDALKESTGFLLGARKIQNRWFPELEVEMAAVLDAHAGLLRHLHAGAANQPLPGGPLNRTVNCAMACQWARLG